MITNMSEIKTKATNQNVREYLNTIEPEEKRRDSIELLEIMEKITKEMAVLWGTSIVGFGKYHYKSERSKQEGDWPLIGFSPRKENLTIYMMNGFSDYQDLLARLGKHKTSVGCLYLKRLADIDINTLRKIIELSYTQMKVRYKI